MKARNQGNVFGIMVIIVSGLISIGCLPDASILPETDIGFGGIPPKNFFNSFKYILINSDSEYEVSAEDVTEVSGNIIIPDSHKGLSVTKIAKEAFFNANKITSVFLPDSIKEIGDSAFRSCSALEIIRIPEGLEIIGEWAIADCTKLPRINLPAGITVVGEGAFSDSNSLTIYCEAPTKPGSWHSDWNFSNRQVIWGTEISNKIQPVYSVMSVGRDHSLVIDEDGNIWAWGINANSVIGDGTTIDRPNPVQINKDGRMNNAKAVSVAAGPGHSFAIDVHGNLWAWGWNGWGCLGDGTSGGFGQSVPVLINKDGIMNNAKVINVVAGNEHSLAIDEHGYLWAWGRDSHGSFYGSLGIGKTGVYKTTPELLNTNGRMNNARIMTVSTKGGDIGVGHNLAVDEFGNLWAWGIGELGDGNFGPSAFKTIPVLINTDGRINNAKITNVSAGGAHSLAIDEHGNLWAWGLNSYPRGGQVGDGTRIDRYIPVQINTGGRINDSKIINISAGESHSLAIDEHRNLWGWGNNETGQLGDGHGYLVTPEGIVVDQPGTSGALHSTIPVLVNTNGRMNDNKALSIQAGSDQSLCLDEHGDLWLWGSFHLNRFDVANGTMLNSNIPIQINIGKEVNNE